jgi:hypothetical protein
VPILSRHFAFKHPLFRKERTDLGVPWRESVYFLWWEFLRRHDGYRRECERGGGGRYARLYADFGDVHATDFRTWWREGDRGARLFAEPPVVTDVRVVHPRDLAELGAGWDEGAMAVIAIPLSFTKRRIAREVAGLIARRNVVRGSRARYPVGQHNLHSLWTALMVYDLRKGRPEMTLWQIAEEVNLGTRLTKEELNAPRGSSPGRVHKQSALAVAASRKLLMAKNIIDGVGRGVFPAFAGSRRVRR